MQVCPDHSVSLTLLEAQVSENTSNEFNESIDVPLHRQIADVLTQQVTQGDLKPGQRLPSERHIAEQFHASRATVRTALQHLEQSGLITRRERRSAVVAFRRSENPSVRIACGSIPLLHLFRRLGELQKLPARYQLQYVDLQQPDAFGQMVSQPAESADILICPLHDVACLAGYDGDRYRLSQGELSEAKVSPVMQQLFMENHRCSAVALGVWPQVLYVNHQFDESLTSSFVPFGHWQWHNLETTIRELKSAAVDYTFQFRPTFEHISSLMISRGCRFFDEKGRLDVGHRSFVDTLRFMETCLHGEKVTPLLAKAETINLFADQRCVLALDGLNMYSFYRRKIGAPLGISRLPQPSSDAAVPLYGFAAVVLAQPEYRQPSVDLLYSLLSAKTQVVLHQLSGCLPVRKDLLAIDALVSLGLPEPLARFALEALGQGELPGCPQEPGYKHEIESLFLELWLGLDRLENLCRRFSQI